MEYFEKFFEEEVAQEMTLSEVTFLPVKGIFYGLEKMNDFISYVKRANTFKNIELAYKKFSNDSKIIKIKELSKNLNNDKIEKVDIPELLSVRYLEMEKAEKYISSIEASKPHKTDTGIYGDSMHEKITDDIINKQLKPDFEKIKSKDFKIKRTSTNKISDVKTYATQVISATTDLNAKPLSILIKGFKYIEALKKKSEANENSKKDYEIIQHSFVYYMKHLNAYTMLLLYHDVDNCLEILSKLSK